MKRATRIGWGLLMATGASVLALSVGSSRGLAQGAPHVTAATAIEAGRYLVRLGGCNDCHTDGYAESGGQPPPEADWLTGSAVGFRGPWGTSYPPNVRLYVQQLSEGEWAAKMRVVVGRPPMPYPSLHAMSEADLRATYQFIQNLGPKGQEAPPALLSGETPKTPYINFMPQTGG